MRKRRRQKKSKGNIRRRTTATYFPSPPPHLSQVEGVLLHAQCSPQEGPGGSLALGRVGRVHRVHICRHGLPVAHVPCGMGGDHTHLTPVMGGVEARREGQLRTELSSSHPFNTSQPRSP